MFDLRHQNPYCAAGSVMDIPQDANGNNLPCGTMDGRFFLQPSDALAVVKGTYGSTPQKMCGKPPGT
jgi:hypothetical protein